MAEFLAILAIYYLCDATAATRQLTSEELNYCMTRYEAVKEHFLPDGARAARGTPEFSAQNREAYQGFKRWEAENADLVASLRAPDRLH